LKEASLDFDPATETMIVRVVDPLVARNPMLSAYVRNLGGRPGDGSTISIPTKAEQLPARVQALTKILTSLGVAIAQGERASEQLGRIRDEESQFTEFSRQAFEIWNRNIETDQFKKFVAALGSECPGRVFYRKQVLSAFHLAFSQNACNFSVPGAGKTSIVYAAFAYLRSLPRENPKHIERLLIIGPLSSFKAWEDEFTVIFGRKPRSKRISGVVTASERADFLRGVSLEARDTELVLASYPSLTTAEDDFAAYLRDIAPATMFVLDEAHYIKRDDGVWAASALRLARFAAARVVLTGTPAPNGYEDLANLFRFIYPTRNITGFPIQSLRAMSDGGMSRAVPILLQNIQPFYTRIKKADLGLPPFVEVRVEVKMHEAHERIYRAFEQKIVPQLRAALGSQQGQVRIAARLIRLRQASVNPSLLLAPLELDELFAIPPGSDITPSELDVENLVRAFEPTSDLQRIEECRKLVQRIIAEEGKVLIWSYFLGNLQLLRNELSGMAGFVEVLTGATPVSSGSDVEEPDIGSRESIIARFHSTGGSAILIANPQAVAESISLHKACRSAIYFDRDFNAGRFIQSKDRIHRYNPAPGKQVSYYYLTSTRTIDRDIDVRLTAKEQRLAAIVDSADIPLLTDIDSRSTDDIKEVLIAYERRKTA
jgi:SNF2 family DNA or RNA helicase